MKISTFKSITAPLFPDHTFFQKLTAWLYTQSPFKQKLQKFSQAFNNPADRKLTNKEKIELGDILSSTQKIDATNEDWLVIQHLKAQLFCMKAESFESSEVEEKYKPIYLALKTLPSELLEKKYVNAIKRYDELPGYIVTLQEKDILTALSLESLLGAMSRGKANGKKMLEALIKLKDAQCFESATINSIVKYSLVQSPLITADIIILLAEAGMFLEEIEQFPEGQLNYRLEEPLKNIKREKLLTPKYIDMIRPDPVTRSEVLLLLHKANLLNPENWNALQNQPWGITPVIKGNLQLLVNKKDLNQSSLDKLTQGNAGRNITPIPSPQRLFSHSESDNIIPTARPKQDTKLANRR
jgi:hypothetical protein